MEQEERSRPVRIGLDVGGTFTDVYLYDEASGRSMRHKLASTPSSPYQAPVAGIREILAMAGCSPGQVGFVGLGTTVATNALLESKGAVTGLITTRGFRDVYEIARQKRPHPYDLSARRERPLASRARREEVTERTAADGSVLQPLIVSEVDGAMERLLQQGVRSVAICFINAYANPLHEQQVAAYIRQRWPEVSVTASSELVPEFREYERMSTTVVNAYLIPVMQDYLQRFSEAVLALGIEREPFIVTSSGGIVTPVQASSRPVDTLLSGPSGGVGYAAYLAGQCGRPDMITLDMGGTSTDVALIHQRTPMVTRSRMINGLHMQGTAVDVHTVGAGGSSVAWLDPGGLLRVGPNSAGARPGPACYGHPGAQPTVTDANVVLGRLNQEALLAGALPIKANCSAEAIDRDIARVKGLATDEAASAILSISTHHIAQAIRFVSVERGLDPRRFILAAFGGAGPLHAAEVARELDMDVLIPPGPGVLCAMGVLTRDVELDASRSRLLPHAPSTVSVASDLYDTLAEGLAQRLGQYGGEFDAVQYERSVDMRYVGQSFEITIVLAPGSLTKDALQAARLAFDKAHAALYGYDKPADAVEFVTWRLAARIVTDKPELQAQAMDGDSALAVPVGSRRCYFSYSGAWVVCPIYERQDLPIGGLIAGPAIVEQMDTTTIIPPDFSAKVDAWGNLILTRDLKEKP